MRSCHADQASGRCRLECGRGLSDAPSLFLVALLHNLGPLGQLCVGGRFVYASAGHSESARVSSPKLFWGRGCLDLRMGDPLQLARMCVSVRLDFGLASGSAVVPPFAATHSVFPQGTPCHPKQSQALYALVLDRCVVPHLRRARPSV